MSQVTAPHRSAPVDGFGLAYDDHDEAGDGPPVVLLHGWPGDRTDYRDLVPLLREHARLVVPDLRGFGGSDKHDEPPAEAYSATAQARSVRGLLDDLDHHARVYGAPGAFTASIGWYRSGAGSVAQARHDTPPDTRSTIPLHVVWPHHDPLFPLAWADRLDQWFTDVTLTEAPDAGHFVPLEAPQILADAIRTALEEHR